MRLEWALRPRERAVGTKVRDAVLKRHPILEGLEGLGVSTLDLQFHEAEVIGAAMRGLWRREGVAALPVFDSLVVPASKARLAKAHLEEAFTRYFDELRPGGEPIVPRVHIGA